MSDKGEGGVKNFKKWVTSFIDGPLVKLFESEDQNKYTLPQAKVVMDLG